jgi:2-dehydro-3-deoxyglucarate aldolase/4-hydroxy-2-oxoheptanedioate aldolase
MMRTNPVKQTLAAGGVSVGTMVFEFSTTGIGRIAAAAGADFVVFDMEHTGWSIETVRMLVATTRAADIVPMVRVPATQYHLLSRPLDVGAMGLMVPMVEDEDQARLIVRSAKYTPDGARGTAFVIAHDDYQPGDVAAKMRSANEEVLLIAQIETARGVEQVDAIAAVEGIDVLWIGHFDLTASLGIPAQFDHPRFIEAVDRVVDACRRHGKTAGIMAASVENAVDWLDRGFRAVAYSGDLWLYHQALAEGIGAIRSRMVVPSAADG